MATSRLSFRLLVMVFVLILVEGLSWLGLEIVDYLMPSTEIIPPTRQIYSKQLKAVEALLNSQTGATKGILVLDAELGWRYREGYTSGEDQINNQGIRSHREYSSRSQPGITRVALFGDSFSYGSEVSNQEAWATRIEGIFPELEVLNYAVPGFGVDQAYLRYLRDGKSLHPDIVLIGFAPVNIRRVVNVYRRFISTNEVPLFKPRYVLNDEGKLELISVPLKLVEDYERLLHRPRLVENYGEYDQWYSPAVFKNPLYDWSMTMQLATNVGIRFYQKVLDPDRILVGSESGARIFNTKSAAFRIQVALFEKFYQSVLDAEATPVFIFLPSKEDIYRVRKGTPTVYSPLRRLLQSRNYAYVDTIDGFSKLPADFNVERLFAAGGHYSKEGNEIVANFVGQNIRRMKD